MVSVIKSGWFILYYYWNFLNQTAGFLRCDVLVQYSTNFGSKKCAAGNLLEEERIGRLATLHGKLPRIRLVVGG